MRVVRTDNDGIYAGWEDEQDDYRLRGGETIEMPPEWAPPYRPRLTAGGAWEMVEDHRGAAVYNTATGQRSEITTLGPIPDGYTAAEPAPFTRWNGDAWVHDHDQWVDAFVRPQRNALLAATDWTQLPDAPLTEDMRLAYRTYRQALRDLPEHITIDRPDFPAVRHENTL